MDKNVSGDQISNDSRFPEVHNIARFTPESYQHKIFIDHVIISIQSLFRNYLKSKTLIEASLLNITKSKCENTKCLNERNCTQWNSSGAYFGTELDITEVTPNLYLGSIHDAENIKLLREKNINFVVQLLENENECARLPLITYYFIEIKDNGSENLLEKLKGALDFIDESHKARGNVLVHCRAGLSRSPSIIIAYMIIKFGYNEYTALKALRRMRPGVNPNNGFKKQLKKFRKANNLPF
ncbi:unnamed protein product [Blepharisma stoltei]|uniref:protein-tyrosine-phosphatase n=1 Tax=Blepharisma stoltei TaxID=1481888 RepID=A0AAU9KCQ4_9CILI|nr:unnamed protein product [Blepharisma stoltei]